MECKKTLPEIISVQNLWAGYGHESVLKDINLSIKKLDFIGLLGPNGGGKTTLLKVLLGLLKPIRGKVYIMGQSAKEMRHCIGYVPQTVEFDRDFPISVWDVTQMGRLDRRQLFRGYSNRDNAIVSESLRKVGLFDLKDRSIGELSGGQKQRAYIARALATEPQILLLDEPTASIDQQASTHIFEFLNKLNSQVTILMVSHDISAISSYVKTVGCLNRRLFYHGDKQISEKMLTAAYHCPVDLIAHGIPHRVFPKHDGQEIKQ